MKTAEFETFLDLFPDYIPYFKTFPKPQCLANCQLFEDQYFDLDEAFECDKGEALLASLPDSTFEESQMKQSIIFYMEFRDYQSNTSKHLTDSDKYKLEKDILMIENDSSLSQEQKYILTINGIEQSPFKTHLLEYWEGCSVTGCNIPELLTVAQIKPYSACNKDEMFDVYNGLLLNQNYITLFDANLISFDMLGKILISDTLTDNDLLKLGISKKDRLRANKFTMNHAYYLEERNELIL